jgi:hypothetical protein
MSMTPNNPEPQPEERTEMSGSEKTDSVKAELDDLRAQLEAARSSGPVSNTPGGAPSDEKESGSTSGTSDQAAGTEQGLASSGDLQAQVQELIDAFGRELKETNPITLLAVFALGVLTGRLLPR